MRGSPERLRCVDAWRDACAALNRSCSAQLLVAYIHLCPMQLHRALSRWHSRQAPNLLD